jgi:hypothetical protein
MRAAVKLAPLLEVEGCARCVSRLRWAALTDLAAVVPIRALADALALRRGLLRLPSQHKVKPRVGAPIAALVKSAERVLLADATVRRATLCLVCG